MHRLIAATTLLLHVLLLAWSASRHSPTYDETGHLVAGISHLETGRHDLYCVNPPLVRLMAAVPVWLSSPIPDWSAWSPNPASRSEFVVGRQFVTANGTESMHLFTIARWACIPFSLLGAMGCYLFARDLYGNNAALGALILWCASPNILGHAQLITPDAAAAAIGILHVYTIWKWMERFSWEATWLAGVSLGLALATKSTWVILLPLWPLVTCAVWLHRHYRRTSPCSMLRALSSLLVMLLLSLFVLNLVYEFDGTGRPLGDEIFLSKALTGKNEIGNRFRGTVSGTIPVPFPRDFIRGIDLQKYDIDRIKPSYLRGVVRQGGWWYYYFYAMAVKMPLGTLALLMVASAGLFVAALRRQIVLGEVLLITIAILIITLVSSQTQMNKHMRYVLPAFPFLFVLCSRSLRQDQTANFGTGSKALKGFAIGALLIMSVSSLRICPHSLSYFNEAAGGLENGGFHLLSSNFAWGQDLIFLREWLEDHPEVQNLGLAAHCSIDPRALGIEFKIPPTAGRSTPTAKSLKAPPRWYAVDANMLYGYPYMIPDGKGGRYPAHNGEFMWFQQFTPVARAGYSINIYELTHDDLRTAGVNVASNQNTVE